MTREAGRPHTFGMQIQCTTEMMGFTVSKERIGQDLPIGSRGALIQMREDHSAWII